MMNPATTRQLRILLADERPESLARLAELIPTLGHVVIETTTAVEAVVALSEQAPVDVAIVVVGQQTQRPLDLISRLVREAICPVIALLDVEDAAFVREAARRGVFAYIVSGEAGREQLASAFDVVLGRFAEYHALEGAFGRRALIERAKGILMERHGIDEEAAFRLLREHSRTANRKLIDIAQAVLDAHPLLGVPTAGEDPA
jgi:response regulator NasT